MRMAMMWRRMMRVRRSMGSGGGVFGEWTGAEGATSGAVVCSESGIGQKICGEVPGHGGGKVSGGHGGGGVATVVGGEFIEVFGAERHGGVGGLGFGEQKA
jgi:hypothetical protein